MVHVHGQHVEERAVVVGAELVSWSAVLTLKESGCDTVALVSRYPKSESYRLFSGPGKLLFGTRVETNSRVVAIHGRGRVESVEVENTVTGKRAHIPCDTVVFTGDWIADNEIARMGGLDIEPMTGAPIVDSAMRTSRPGVFAVGNMSHPVDTADIVAIEGQHAGDMALRCVENLDADGDYAWPTAASPGVELRAQAPLQWISPSRLYVGDPMPVRDRLVAFVDRYIPFPVLTVEQAGSVVSRTRLLWPAAPGRAFRIPANVLKGIDPRRGAVTVSIA